MRYENRRIRPPPDRQVHTAWTGQSGAPEHPLHRRARSFQNPYFTPNCMMRGAPAIEVTRPNAGELKLVSVSLPF